MLRFKTPRCTRPSQTSLLAAALLSVLLLLAAPLAGAQAAPAPKPPAPAFTMPPPTPNDTLKSPEVQADGTVLFRLYAPAAKDVKLQAEGLESTPGMTQEQASKNYAGAALTRAEDGVWSIAFGPIWPGVYRYVFLADGVRVMDPKNPLASQSLNSGWSMYEVPGAKFLEYNRDTPHGAIASVWYDSAATGGLRRMHVYTPPGYEKGSAKYPVLYLLHGAMDTDDSWGTVGRAGAILDNLIAAHEAVPMIVVMPAGHMTREFQMRLGPTTMGHDSFTKDLIESVLPSIDGRYRTITDRDHRAIAGLSMGGIQALDISLENSGLFAYVGLFSSGWFPQVRENEEATDLAQYKASGKPFKVFWMAAGKLDMANASSKVTAEMLKKAGIQAEQHESEGFHAWNNWRDYLHTFAPLLFR